MSYILDALKKAEHEKQKKTAPAGMSSITGDLFQERTLPTSNRVSWRLIAILFLVALAASAGTWFVAGGKKAKKAAVVPVVVVQPLTGAVPLPPHPPEQLKAPLQSAPVTPPVTKAAGRPVSSVKDVAGERPVGAVVKVNSKQVANANPAAQVLKPVTPSIQPPADIKVSGIAWQDEHSARRAVINGFLVKEGGMVSGARVSEILTDRVRFVAPAGRYEIRLDNAPVTEGKR